MTIKAIRETVSFDGRASHLTFEYNGMRCGIDPISRDHFEMWYGDTDTVAKSIDEVMTIPLFAGKTLSEISNEIIKD